MSITAAATTIPTVYVRRLFFPDVVTGLLTVGAEGERGVTAITTVITFPHLVHRMCFPTFASKVW